jgi:hypothetical protein
MAGGDLRANVAFVLGGRADVVQQRTRRTGGMRRPSW